MTGLRGFAALWVVSLHFIADTNTLLPASAGFNWFLSAGANAVPLFFVLSGFILLHTYRARFAVFSWGEYARFLGLRLARIYPAYLAALAAMLLLVAGSAGLGLPHNANAYPWPWLLPEALMLHCWRTLPPNFFGWNFPDWSVSAEWFAYLFIFPLAVGLLKKLGGGGKWLAGGLVLLLCALEPAIRTEWKLPMVSLLFLAGAGLWELRRQILATGKKLPPHLDSLGVAGLLLTVWLASWHGGGLTAAGILLAMALLIFGLTRADGLFSRLLAQRPWVFLGELSYSIYLIHGVVQRFLKVALPVEKFAMSPWPLRTGVWLVELAAVLLAATLLYFAVESPARGWLRRKFSRRQT